MLRTPQKMEPWAQLVSVLMGICWAGLSIGIFTHPGHHTRMGNGLYFALITLVTALVALSFMRMLTRGLRYAIYVLGVVFLLYTMFDALGRAIREDGMAVWRETAEKSGYNLASVKITQEKLRQYWATRNVWISDSTITLEDFTGRESVFAFGADIAAHNPSAPQPTTPLPPHE
ncbi:MAG: hypothetical protein HY074_03960 [Deltaproteobacteria bacterium]|nr:hypothetical protein [Deltaproteobacteria bacterium]